jgi:hypothetical protein
MATDRFPRRLTVIPGGAARPPALDEIRLVVDEYLLPSAGGLKAAADDDDVDAVRAFAFELLAAAGTVIAACPRPRTSSEPV